MLRLTEIFYSLQGEAATQGIPTTFIRTSGCPLRCHYCDTPYAFQGGTHWNIGDILQKVEQLGATHVTVTGGEPLVQASVLDLLHQLVGFNYQVSLETSGALDITPVDPGVSVVMDLKTPGSGEVTRNRYDNITRLKAKDQLKFVLCHYDDYLWAKEMVNYYQLVARCPVFFLPSAGELSASELAGWILADCLPVRLQIQLHKYLWGDERGR